MGRRSTAGFRAMTSIGHWRCLRPAAGPTCGRFHRLAVLAGLVALLPLVLAVPSAGAQRGGVALALGPTGADVEGDGTVLVATQLTNLGDRLPRSGSTWRTSGLSGAGRRWVRPCPSRFGRIGAGRSVTIEVTFSADGLQPGQAYHLDVAGSYSIREADDGAQDGNDARPNDIDFRVDIVVQLPPTAPGSNGLGSVDVPAQHVSGAPFPAHPPTFDEDVNPPGWLVPTAPERGGTPTPTGTEVTPAPFGDPPAITFEANNGVGLTGSLSTTAEPSGASGGGVEFVSANWRAGFSTNNGASFTSLNPTTIFLTDAVGFCCDRSSITRRASIASSGSSRALDGYRLASASPAAIMSSGGTAWTYWNLTPQVFGEPAGTSFDYPDMALGDNELYMSWDGGGQRGLQVARTSRQGSWPAARSRSSLPTLRMPRWPGAVTSCRTRETRSSGPATTATARCGSSL